MWTWHPSLKSSLIGGMLTKGINLTTYVLAEETYAMSLLIIPQSRGFSAPETREVALS